MGIMIAPCLLIVTILKVEFAHISPFFVRYRLKLDKTRKLGSYRCECSFGYRKIGSQCQDINECRANTHDCNQNAKVQFSYISNQ